MTSLLLDALAGTNLKRPPVWLMRQAGRYLPEYQAMRGRYSLRELFLTPELAAEVTLMPLELVGVDAAILFSDIMVIALALGLGLDFRDGPVIEPLLGGAEDVEKLECLDVRETLGFVGEAARLSCSELPLIGFCGGPFTVASYLIEKHVGEDLVKTKRWLDRDPESFYVLLDKIARVSVDYLKMQVENGAEAIQIFDSWAHVLTEEQFVKVCLPYWKRLLGAVGVPGIVFARGNSFRIQAIEGIRPAAISMDWGLPMHVARRQTAVSLQGNLDPDLLFLPLDEVERQVRGLLDSMRGDKGFIVNLGHGVKPNTPVEAVRRLVDTVRNYAG